MDSDKLNDSNKLREELIKKGSHPKSEKTVKHEFLSYFKKNRSKIKFGERIEKIYDLLTSGRLTGRDKALIIGALLYFINPFDVIPDVLPYVGFLDDMTVIGLAYRYLINRSLE